MKAKYTSQLLISWLVMAFTVMTAATNAHAQSAGGQLLQSSSVAEHTPIQKSALEHYSPRILKLYPWRIICETVY